jgi:RNA polymerase sigma-70 factor (ECF subfamily)
MGISAADLDDACQEVFVQVFRYLARFERRADFQTWLYKLCLSQAARIRRQRRVHEALHWLLGGWLSRQETAIEPEWNEPMAALRVKQAIDRMKPMHKEVFVLFELEGVAGDEIARILRCPPATIRRRLHYARAEFESLLRMEEVGGEK